MTSVSRPERRPVRRTALAGALALAAAALGAGAVVLVAGASPTDQAGRAIREAAIIAVPVLTGLYAMRTPQSRRFGQMLIGCGALWALTALAESSESLSYSIGRVAAFLIFPLLLWLILAFPEGRLAPGLDRNLYGALLVLFALYIGSALFVEAYPSPSPWALCDADCPPNAFMVLDSEPAVMERVIQPVRDLLTVVLMTGVIYALVRRMRGGTRLWRQQITPVLIAGIGSCGLLLAYLVTRRYWPEGGAVEELGSLWALSIPALAAAFFVGLLRRRLLVAQVLERLSVALDGPLDGRRLRTALADALDDPEVDVLTPDEAPGRWRDTHGRLTSTSEALAHGRQVTPLGNPEAVLVHDPSLRADDELLQAVCSLVHGTLRHEELRRRLTWSLHQLVDSRARLLRTADLERSRIERDLHDGAQQRLILLRIKISLAEELLRTDPAAAAGALAELGAEVERALDELRAVAHGIYPSLLTDRGLEDALRGIVSEATLPVHIDMRGLTRQPAELETAVYFTCLEALQNAIKHAHGATGIWISVRQGTALTLEVRDDGPGFVPPSSSNGSGGLRNMRDRIEAVGGRLTIDSKPAHGTRVLGTVPLRGRGV